VRSAVRHFGEDFGIPVTSTAATTTEGTA
jgi:hypothetical protein